MNIFRRQLFHIFPPFQGLFQTKVASQRISNPIQFNPTVVGMQPARKTFQGAGPYQFTTNFPGAAFQVFVGGTLMDLGTQYTFSVVGNVITINIVIGSAKLTIFYWN